MEMRVLLGTRRIRGCWSQEIAECKAVQPVLLGVKLAKRYGVDKMIVEGDCCHLKSYGSC